MGGGCEGLEPTLSNDWLKNERLERILSNDRFKNDLLKLTLSNDRLKKKRAGTGIVDSLSHFPMIGAFVQWFIS
jgi:hypothetical protein